MVSQKFVQCVILQLQISWWVGSPALSTRKYYDYTQGRNQKGGWSPYLSQVKVKNQDKISDSFGLFYVSTLSDLKLRDLANLWLKIDYDKVTLQSHRKYIIKMTLQKFSIFKPLA